MMTTRLARAIMLTLRLVQGKCLWDTPCVLGSSPYYINMLTTYVLLLFRVDSTDARACPRSRALARARVRTLVRTCVRICARTSIRMRQECTKRA